MFQEKLAGARVDKKHPIFFWRPVFYLLIVASDHRGAEKEVVVIVVIPSPTVVRSSPFG